MILQLDAAYLAYHVGESSDTICIDRCSGMESWSRSLPFDGDSDSGYVGLLLVDVGSISVTVKILLAQCCTPFIRRI